MTLPDGSDSCGMGRGQWKREAKQTRKSNLTANATQGGDTRDGIASAYYHPRPSPARWRPDRTIDVKHTRGPTPASHPTGPPTKHVHPPSDPLAGHPPPPPPQRGNRAASKRTKRLMSTPGAASATLTRPRICAFRPSARVGIVQT